KFCNRSRACLIVDSSALTSVNIAYVTASSMVALRGPMFVPSTTAIQSPRNRHEHIPVRFPNGGGTEGSAVRRTGLSRSEPSAVLARLLVSAREHPARQSRPHQPPTEPPVGLGIFLPVGTVTDAHHEHSSPCAVGVYQESLITRPQRHRRTRLLRHQRESHRLAPELCRILRRTSHHGLLPVSTRSLSGDLPPV